MLYVALARLVVHGGLEELRDRPGENRTEVNGRVDVEGGRHQGLIHAV